MEFFQATYLAAAELRGSAALPRPVPRDRSAHVPFLVLTILVAEGQQLEQRVQDGHDQETPRESEDGRTQSVHEPGQEAAHHWDPDERSLEKMNQVVRQVPAEI